MRPDPAQELVRLLATACSPPATVDDVLRRVFAQPQPSPPKRPGQRRLAELQGDNSQGWPKLWANFNTLIGVSSHTAGPAWPALRVSGSAFDGDASNRTDPQAAVARSAGLRAFVPGVPADLVEGLGQAVRPAPAPRRNPAKQSATVGPVEGAS